MANFSKKIVSTVGAVSIVASTMSTSLVSAASEFLPYAETLATNKVIGTQSTEAGYRLNDQITRAELAKIAANLGGYNKVSCTGAVYSDVKANLGDLCEAIETLASAGVIAKNTNFRPNALVTRAEMTKMLLGAVGEKASATSAGYADVTATLGDLEGFINRANELKCANTATYFRPQANSSRGEAFKIASCVAKLTPVVTPTTPTTPETPAVVNNGTVTVSAVGTATAQYVPANASSVNVGTFKITATGGDVVVNNVTIARSGLGNSSKVTISVADKTGRISESRSVNSSTQAAVIRLNNPVVIKKGESVELSALATLNTDVNAQHQFALTAVNGTAVTPVNLGLVNTTSYVTSSVNLDSFKVQNVTSGRNDQVLGRVTLRAGSQDATINGFTVTKDSGVDLTRAFSNLNVYRNGTKVGTAAITSDKIIVSGLATDLARNNSAIYELRADVIYVGSQDTIRLSISETEDIVATEKSTGFATQVSGVRDNNGSLLSNNGGDITLSALDIVTNRKAISNTTIAPGTSNVLLIDGNISSEASFDVTSFTVTTKEYPTANTNDVFSSLVLNIGGNEYELINGNNVVTGVKNGSKTYTSVGDRFRVEPGVATPVTLRATLLNNVPAGKLQYEITLNSAKNVSNGNTVTNLNKKITGVAFNISSPTLTIKNSTFSAPTASKIYSNALDFEVARFGLEAKADEVSVNRIVVENTGDLENLVDVFSNVRLINLADGSTVASNPTFDGKKMTFNTVNLRVAKDTTANLKLVVDTNGDLLTNNPNRTFVPKVTISDDNISTGTASTANVSNADDSFTVNKTYTISSNVPTINVKGLTLENNKSVAVIKVTNTDDNKKLNINKVVLGIGFRTTANGTVTFPSNVCIRNVGSSAQCGEEGTTALQNIENGVVTVDIAGSTLTAKDTISDTNGTAEFEVFFPGSTPWVAGDNANISVQKLEYTPEGSSLLSESYIGTAGASVVVTK